MSGKIRVYVAGPIHNAGQVTDPKEIQANIDRAVAAGEVLLQAGAVPFVPHLNCYWHEMYPHDHATWLAWDLEWLGQCNALLRLPGASKGSDIEVNFALSHNIPVFYSLEALARFLSHFQDGVGAAAPLDEVAGGLQG